MEKQVLQKAPTKKLCPLLRNPFDNCYCVKMSSQYIERAVYFCGKHFELCEIYKHVNGNGNDNGKDIRKL